MAAICVRAAVSRVYSDVDKRCCLLADDDSDSDSSRDDLSLIDAQKRHELRQLRLLKQRTIKRRPRAYGVSQDNLNYVGIPPHVDHVAGPAPPQSDAGVMVLQDEAAPGHGVTVPEAEVLPAATSDSAAVPQQSSVPPATSDSQFTATHSNDIPVSAAEPAQPQLHASPRRGMVPGVVGPEAHAGGSVVVVEATVEPQRHISPEGS